LFEEHVPERLLDVFIQTNNMAPTTPATSPTTLLVEATVEETQEEDGEEEEAEAVQLSASFVNSGKGYEYSINDIEKVET
jgi:hypothetical protein